MIMKQVRRVAVLVILTGVMTAPARTQSVAAKEGTSQPEQGRALPAQHFYCNTGFDEHVCQQHVAKLKEVLRRYPADAPGGWKWVIVRSEDWQPLLVSLRLDRRATAFSALGLRSTFLEEALFVYRPTRADELARDFHAPFNQLLSIAVSHELGHAICHERNEAAASRIAEQLRTGRHPECVEASESPTPIEELYLQNRLTGSAGRR
jgi:hypothetical protein